MIDVDNIETPEQALELALILAITAPDKDRADVAIALAGEIATGFNLSEETIFNIQTDIEAAVLAGEELL